MAPYNFVKNILRVLFDNLNNFISFFIIETSQNFSKYLQKIRKNPFQ